MIVSVRFFVFFALLWYPSVWPEVRTILGALHFGGTLYLLAVSICGTGLCGQKDKDDNWLRGLQLCEEPQLQYLSYFSEVP